ncbi:bifunctional tryptophan synthase trp1 [Boothiomyces sp. JEL0866]|nr:bifunctional tryptophan synthase trp1 [Boothiomyces sp. JEL0866]
MVARHGIRWWTEGKQNNMFDLVEYIKQNVDPIKHPRLAKISLPYPRDQAGELAPAGRKELRAFAERFVEKYSKYGIFNSTVKVESSNLPRVLDSAATFLNGLKLKTTIDYVINRQVDADLNPTKACSLYVQNEDTNGAKEQGEIWRDRFIPALQSKFKNVLDFDSKQIYTLMDMCASQIALLNYDKNDGVCFLFNDNDISNYEILDDIEKYYELGYGNSLNGNTACSLLSGIAYEMNTNNKDFRKLVLKFTHAETMAPLITALGLFKDNFKLDAGLPMSQLGHRRFITSVVAPFMGNVIFELYECHEILNVRLLVNEVYHDIPGCGSICSLSQFNELYAVLNKIIHMSFANDTLHFSTQRPEYKFQFSETESLKMTTLLIDNYDSFTWNVYQSLCNLGANVVVHRNDFITLEEAIALNPKNLVISPGPGHPSEAGVSNVLLRHFAGKIPILGVCLGEQCMFELYGGTVAPCGELIHGKTTPVQHDGKGLYEGVSQNIECTRYHSLSGVPNTLPKELKVTSWTESGIIMGVRHKIYVMEGVQYHPESIASEEGEKMFANFLSWEGGLWSELKINRDNLRYAQKSEKEEDVGHGIPLHLASKMNSTAKPTQLKVEKESILQKIYQKRIKDVFEQKNIPGFSMTYLERSYALGLAPPLISFPDRLKQSIHQHGVAVLAEVKRASPSKGEIDMYAHAGQQSLLYAEGGAACISVLTEPNWFKGSITDLQTVRATLGRLPNRPAVLRKEFIFEEYQILEARLAGADTILLIVAMLTDAQLTKLIEYSRNLGMEPLVEVAAVSEMKRAISLGAKVVGVNNRDLNTFQVDMNRTTTLSALTENSDIILLALSGITSRNDVETYIESGAQGVLVGEALMRAASKPDMVKQLLGARKADSTSQKVKICGITNVRDALHACDSGADFIGLIFEEKSPRFVTKETAKAIVQEIRSNYPKTEKNSDSTLLTIPVTASEWYSAQKFDHGPAVVGVFTSHSVAEINEIATFCSLDYIQLHKPRSVQFHKLLNKPVIQVIGIDASATDVFNQVLQDVERYNLSAKAVLLDTTTPNAIGGTGHTFDWSLITKLRELGIPVSLAGGLNPDNVKEASQLKPVFVDVCSGVEASKGIKDANLVSKFIKNSK